MAINLQALQAANRRKTFLLLGMFGALTWLLLFAVFNYFGQSSAAIVPFAVIISLVMVWGSYFSSDKLVLKMTGAKLIQEADNPKLFGLVKEVSTTARLPMPKVAIVEDTAPNAFATGRNPEHALIAFTTGILNRMDRDQLQGVIAHELSHVANRDTLVSAVAATTAGAIALISDFLSRMIFWGRGGRDRNQNPLALVISLLVLILAPIAAMLLKAAISRSRESLADTSAVSYTRNPAGLRSALELLQKDSTVVTHASNAVAHLYIESPLDSSNVSKLFATHPPLSERIQILKEMESGKTNF